MKIVDAVLLPEPAAGKPWAGLSAGSPAPAACSQWLAQLAGEQPPPLRCLVLLRADGNELRLAAAQPAGAEARDLLPLLAQAAASPRAEVFATGQGWLALQPLLWGQELRGLAAAEYLHEGD